MRFGFDLHPELLGLMERQGGVFSGAQAQFFGHPPEHIQWLRRRRPPVLVSVRKGVYAWHETYQAADPVGRHTIDLAALGLRVADDAVISHESAAVHHQLDMLDPDLDRLHLTRRALAHGARVEAGVRHHVAELPPEHVIERPGTLAVTAVARTAVDVARGTDRLPVAVAVLDSALRSGASREALREVHDLCRSWPGVRGISTALDLADGRAENPGESWSRVVLVQQGLAPDALQVPVYDDEGLIGYADFGWDGVLGEFDGKVKYGLDSERVDDELFRRTLWREKRREDRMRVRHEVVRWTAADLHNPRALAGRIRAAQERARRRWRGLGPSA